MENVIAAVLTKLMKNRPEIMLTKDTLPPLGPVTFKRSDGRRRTGVMTEYAVVWDDGGEQRVDRKIGRDFLNLLYPYWLKEEKTIKNEE